MAVRDEAGDIAEEDLWNAKLNERMHEACMPYFIESFLDVHKYGRREVFEISGMQCCLS